MFSRRIVSFATAALLSAALAGCGQRTTPLDQVVFSQEPLKQIQLQAKTFRQIPDDDLKLLLAYLGANEKAQLEGKIYSQVEGKSLMQVIAESKTWQVGMADFLEKSKQISLALGRLVVVTPALKDVQDNENAIGHSQILRISYQLSNKSERTVTALAGVIKYYRPDGRVAATIPLSFDGKIGPGETVNMFGHASILVGSRAAKEMVDFAQAPLSALRFEVATQAIRYEGGEVASIPSL